MKQPTTPQGTVVQFDDAPREACGVVGVYAPGQDVARITFYGLHALQHRGQECAGIASATKRSINLHTAMGLVSQAFRESDLERLEGDIAIGHTRYSTTGSNNLQNAQPILSRSGPVELALGHNGNIINAFELREELKQSGCSFASTTDSEVIAHLLAWAPGESWADKVSYMMRKLQGAYSLVVTTKETLMGIRDPLGIRPLCLGRLNDGWVIASESCALDHLGAEYVREVKPGETVMITSNGLTSIPYKGTSRRPAPCVFEHIYFARPDSILGGKLTYSSRVAMGAQLAKEHPVDADIVIGVPDSATAAAVGYSQESGIPYREGLIRNRYVGRTFIEPDQHFRDLGVRMKFNPLPEVIANKRVVLIDDSIVRGTTTPHVVNLLRKVKAKEIHMRVCAPPIRFPCHFGIDLATRAELIAANMSVEEIRRFINSDSLGYLSVDGLIASINGKGNNFCTACFTGNYPIPVQLEMDKLAMERS